MKIIAAAGLSLLLSSAYAEMPYYKTAPLISDCHVKQVIDGNSFICEDEAKKSYNVTLLHCDTPKIQDSVGKTAKQYLETLILNRPVFMSIYFQDTSGSHITAEVYDRHQTCVRFPNPFPRRSGCGDPWKGTYCWSISFAMRKKGYAETRYIYKNNMCSVATQNSKKEIHWLDHNSPLSTLPIPTPATGLTIIQHI